jgi:chitin disaccharide deacetylase
MKDTRLIVNADDLGMSRGITDAILIAHRHGIVTSASLMVNMPAAEYALEHLPRAPNLGIGVHLNICQGEPVLPAAEVKCLIDADGSFLGPRVLARKLWRWQVDERQIEAEFRAQIQWMRRNGLEPTHADSHRHMHIYPAAVRPFARSLAAEGVRCARAPRCSQWPSNGAVGGPHAGKALRRLSVQTYRSALQAVVFHHISTPDSRISFRPLEQDNFGELGRKWRAAFDNLPPGTFELACHPGISEPGFSEMDAISALREQELRVLMDPETREAIDRNKIRLIPYNELSAACPPQRNAARAAMF